MRTRSRSGSRITRKLHENRVLQHVVHNKLLFREKLVESGASTCKEWALLNDSFERPRITARDQCCRYPFDIGSQYQSQALHEMHAVTSRYTDRLAEILENAATHACHVAQHFDGVNC